MSKITFRKANMNDCYVIAKLKGIVWNTTYKGIYPDEKLLGYDIDKNTLIFQKIVNNPDLEIYVAVHDTTIVGFMTCGKPYRPFLHFQQEIGLLYILKEYQRQGIGRSFFDIARKQVVEKGFKEFFVSVNIKNYSAQKFYIAMGGEIIFTDETQMRLRYKI